jgi:hypothetical protein
MSENDPSKPPLAADSVISVSCDSWREFADRYADDIRNGGLYITTDTPREPLSLLELRLCLPEATEINLRTRVVQVLSAEQAGVVGKAQGMGLELLDMDAERKRQVLQLIEFAQLQGTQDDPNTSFAHTLLELSPALPPAEVGYRLSLLPTPGPPARKRESRSDNPAVPQPTAAEQTRGSAKPDAEKTPSQQPQPEARRPRRASQTSVPIVVDGAAANASPAPAPPKPTDQVKLKLLITEFAHKHYDAVLRLARGMLEANPGDPQALRWQAMSEARLALGRSDEAAALGHYENALRYDEDNREAREFVRTHQREKKLQSIPFGRYFSKKK